MRQTNDADIAIALAESQTNSLVAAFPEPYTISRDEVDTALASTVSFRSVQLMHMDEVFKIDLFLLDESEYSAGQLTRARSVEVIPGAHVRFSSPKTVSSRSSVGLSWSIV